MSESDMEAGVEEEISSDSIRKKDWPAEYGPSYVQDEDPDYMLPNWAREMGLSFW